MLKYKSSKLVLFAVVSLVMAWAAAADVYGQNQMWVQLDTIEVNELDTVLFFVWALDDDADTPDDFFLALVDIPPAVYTPYDTMFTDADVDSIILHLEWVTGYADSGFYKFVFAASDKENPGTGGANPVYDTVFVHVTNVNQVPVIETIGAQSTDENVNLNFTVTASDPDGDTPALALGANDLPAGPTYFTDNGDGTGDFDWTPTFLDADDYTVTFEAIDSTVSPPAVVTQTILITVNNINRDPVVELRYPLGTFTVTEGDEDSVVFMAWDPDFSEGDDVTIDFLDTTLFGTPSTSVVGDSTKAVITLNPDSCVTGVGDLSTFVRVQATDDSGVAVDAAKFFDVIDAGNEPHTLSVDAADVSGLFLNFPTNKIDTLRVVGFDRDCDQISYAYSLPEDPSFVQSVVALGGDAFTPVGDSQEVNLQITLTNNADGVFHIDLVASSDHGGIFDPDEDTVRVMIDVQDKIAPTADSLLASDPTCGTTCPDVTVEGFYSDIGAGMSRIVISYLQGSSAAAMLFDTTIVGTPSTAGASYVFEDSFFTVMGLAAVFDAFDGSSADTTMLFGQEIIGNHTSDTVVITYSYTDRGDALVAGSATLFSGSSATVPQDRWTLFSIPTDIPSPHSRIDSIFSSDIDNYAADQYTAGWRVYSWLPANARYLQMETSEVLRDGMCFFFRMIGKDSYANFNLNLPEGSISLEPFDFGSILEPNAWNFLGNPYPFTVDLAPLIGMSGDDVNSWYTYNDATGSWVVMSAGANNTIPAYGGFIVNTGSNPNLVLKSAVAASGAPAAKMVPADEMMISFELNASGLKDQVDVGFRVGAAKGFGDEDYLKFTPSLEDRYLNFGVDNFGWDNTPGLYRIDVRDFPSEGESWPLMMYSYNVTDGTPVEIKWEVGDASAAFGVWLIDNYAEKRIDMLQADSYSFGHVGSVEDGRFTVVAGTSEFLAGYIANSNESLPGEFVLHQNYPNPFNPQTTVAFDLARSGDVELTVFNVLGRKVKTVFDGKLLKGHHEFDWDGTNDAGTAIASGVYFYRLQTAGATKARKMLLLK